MASPESVDAPLYTQVGLALAAIGSGILAWMRSQSERKAEKEKPAEAASHVVMETASLADTRPFRDLLQQLIATGERNARANEAILSAVQEWVEEERKLKEEHDRELNYQRYVAEALRLAEENRDKRDRLAKGPS